MGFGRGVGFTSRAVAEITIDTLVRLLPWGYLKFRPQKGKLISSRTAVASGTSASQSTAGKLTSSRITEVT